MTADNERSFNSELLGCLIEWFCSCCFSIPGGITLWRCLPQREAPLNLFDHVLVSDHVNHNSAGSTLETLMMQVPNHCTCFCFGFFTWFREAACCCAHLLVLGVNVGHGHIR